MLRYSLSISLSVFELKAVPWFIRLCTLRYLCTTTQSQDCTVNFGSDFLPPFFLLFFLFCFSLHWPTSCWATLPGAGIPYHLLEDPVWDFLQLACQIHYPDRLLCVFYHTSLSDRSKAHLPANGPKKDFARFVEWVLVNIDYPFTICLADDHTDPTPHPVTSHPPPASCKMDLLEPTADCGDWPAVMDEPNPAMRTEVDMSLSGARGQEGKPRPQPRLCGYY